MSVYRLQYFPRWGWVIMGTRHIDAKCDCARCAAEVGAL